MAIPRIPQIRDWTSGAQFREPHSHSEARLHLSRLHVIFKNRSYCTTGHTSGGPECGFCLCPGPSVQKRSGGAPVESELDPSTFAVLETRSDPAGESSERARRSVRSRALETPLVRGVVPTSRGTRTILPKARRSPSPSIESDLVRPSSPLGWWLPGAVPILEVLLVGPCLPDLVHGRVEDAFRIQGNPRNRARQPVFLP